MTTYYVNSATGSDGNNGTSPGTAKATINAAAALTNAGDTVIIAPGNGYGGGTGGSPIVTISRSGTSGNPITYTGDTTQARPVITTGRGFQVVLINANFINWNYTEISGLGNGCTIAGSYDLIWTGGSSSQYENVGIGANGVAATPAHNINITNNYVHDMPSDGISSLWADYVTIDSNIAVNNAFYSYVAGSGISLGFSKPIDGLTTAKCFITKNICYNNNNLVVFDTGATTTTANGTSNSGQAVLNVASTAGFSAGTFVYNSTRASITNGTYVLSVGAGSLTLSANLVAQSLNGDHIVGGDFSDGEGIIIDTNTDTGGVGAYTGRTVVQNNLCFNNGSGGVYITRSSHCDVNFNTCWQNQQGFSRNDNTHSIFIGSIGLFVSASSADNNLYNNLVVSPSWGPCIKNAGTTTTFSTNLGNGGDGTALPGSGNITTAPTFFNASTNPAVMDFRLKNSSAGVNAASATYTRTVDISGRKGSIGSASDIGCYEGRLISLPAM